MTNLENIQYRLERAVLASQEVSTLVANYPRLVPKDPKTLADLLRMLADADPFFVNLDPQDLRAALATFRMPK